MILHHDLCITLPCVAFFLLVLATYLTFPFFLFSYFFQCCCSCLCGKSIREIPCLNLPFSISFSLSLSLSFSLSLTAVGRRAVPTSHLFLNSICRRLRGMCVSLATHHGSKQTNAETSYLILSFSRCSGVSKRASKRMSEN